MGIDNTQDFDALADHYDDHVCQSEDFPFLGYEKVLGRVVSMTFAIPSSRILDLGIGTGNLARLFADRGCRIWGIDRSANMISHAKAKLSEAQLAIADLMDSWPAEFGRRFDFLVSAYVFHHLDLHEKTDLLMRLRRDHCAKGAGIVIADLSFPSGDALEQARIRWKEHWDEEYYWVADEVIPVCEQMGLRVRYEQVVECAGVFYFEPEGTE